MGLDSANRYLEYFQSLRKTHGGLPQPDFENLITAQLLKIRKQLVGLDYEPAIIDVEMRLAEAAARRACLARPVAEPTQVSDERAPTAPSNWGDDRIREAALFSRLGDAHGGGPGSWSKLPADRLTPGLLFAAIRRHYGRVIAATLLFVLAGVALAFVLEERFSSTALLLLEPHSDPALGPTILSPTAADSEVEILKSDLIALRVAQRLALDADPEFAPQDEKPNPLRAALAYLRERLGRGQSRSAAALADSSGFGAMTLATRSLQKQVAVRRRGMTDVVAIEATTRTPSRAAEIANAYAETYLQHQLQARLRKFDLSEAAVADQVRKYNDELVSADAQARVRARDLYRESLAQLTALSQKRLLVLPKIGRAHV